MLHGIFDQQIKVLMMRLMSTKELKLYDTLLKSDFDCNNESNYWGSQKVVLNWNFTFALSCLFTWHKTFCEEQFSSKNY